MSSRRYHHHPTARTFTPLAVSLAISLAVGACADEGRPAADTASDTVAPPAPAAAPAGRDTGATAGRPALDDARIAHVAVTTNSIDSAAGELAKGKATSRAVRDFAQTMITDHGAVNRQAVALATRLGVTPQPNDVSRELQSGADQAQDSLRRLGGAAFDRAYMDREVAYHQAVLDALDQTLIPGAKNAELKQLLETVRPNIAGHLARAKQVQGDLGSR